ITGDIGDVDALQMHAAPVPVIRIALELQRGAVYPAFQHKGAVVEQIGGIGAVTLAAAAIKILAHRVITEECRQPEKIRTGPLELDFELESAERAHAELLRRQLAAIDLLGILDREKS